VSSCHIAINTRKEISYAVHQCSRYMTKATKAQYEVLKEYSQISCRSQTFATHMVRRFSGIEALERL